MNDDVIPIDRYPARPQPYAGESLASYCWRIYMFNGHKPNRAVMAACELLLGTLKDDGLPVLSGFIGKELATRMRATESDLITVKLGVHALVPVWLHQARHPQFCPRCIAQTRFHRLLWDMPLVSACPTHRCRLITRCQGCRKHLTWLQLTNGFTCSCGRRIEDTLIEPAHNLAIWLAAKISQAPDFLEKTAPPDAGGRSSTTVGPHTTREIYEAIDWVNRARQVLTYKFKDGTRTEGPGRRLARPRKVPCVAVLRFIAGLPKTATRSTARLVFGALGGEATALVRLTSDVALYRMTQMLTELKETKNPLLSLISDGVYEYLDSLSIEAKQLHDVIYHPGLPQNAQRAVDFSLTRWWSRLSDRLQPVDKAYQLPDDAESPGYLTSWLSESSDDQLNLLNALLDIALDDVPVDAFSALTARWQAPAQMLGKKVGLSQIADGLASLHPAERAFFAALLLQGWLSADRDGSLED